MNKNAKIFLTIGSCVGVAGTMVLTHLGTCKAMDIMQTKHPNEKIGKTQELKETWKYYIPAVIAGVATIVSIVVNHKMTAKELAALAATSGLSYTTLKKYKEKVKEIAGHSTFVEIEKAMAKDAERGIQHAQPAIHSETICSICQSPIESGTTLFYEPDCDIWFRSSKEAVIAAQYHLNRNFQLGAVETVEEYLTFLGVTDNKRDWSKIGWGREFIEGGCVWIDFDFIESVTDDGEPYYIVEATFGPDELVEGDDY